MATKRVYSLKNNEALVKIEGAVGAVTIDLDVDLLGAGEALNGGTQTVVITGITWTGTTGTATIARNGVTVIAVPGANPGTLGLNERFYEDGGKTFDIVVTTATTEMQVWLRLSKISGYRPKFEPEQFGSYDNPAVVDA